MAAKSLQDKIIPGDTHGRSSEVLSSSGLSHNSTCSRKTRSFFHDFTYIMLPVALFLHFIITGTVILVYTIYFSRKLPRTYTIGAAAGFGVLFLLILSTRIVLQYNHSHKLPDEESQMTTTTTTATDDIQPSVINLCGDLAMVKESQSRFPGPTAEAHSRPISELSAVSTEIPVHFEGSSKRSALHIPVRRSSRTRSVRQSCSSMTRPKSGFIACLESVAEVSREDSGSSSKSVRSGSIRPEHKRTSSHQCALASQKRLSLEILRSDSPLSFVFEPSPGSGPALRFIKGDIDLDSIRTYEEDEMPFRSPTELGGREDKAEINEQLDRSEPPCIPDSLLAGKVVTSRSTVHRDFHVGPLDSYLVRAKRKPTSHIRTSDVPLPLRINHRARIHSQVRSSANREIRPIAKAKFPCPSGDRYSCSNASKRSSREAESQVGKK